MSVLFVILSIVFVVGCVAVVAAILLQEKRSAGGMGTIAGMGSVSDTHFGKNKGRSHEGKLELFTKIGAVALAVFSVILCLI